MRYNTHTEKDCRLHAAINVCQGKHRQTYKVVESVSKGQCVPLSHIAKFISNCKLELQTSPALGKLFNGTHQLNPLGTVEGLMHLAPACALWLVLGVLAVEWPQMSEEGALGLMRAKPLLYLAAAAMGFLVNALAYVVIQTANSLTLKVLGTVKNAMVVWIGVAFIGDIITGLQVSDFLETACIFMSGKQKFHACFNACYLAKSTY